jgi:hypothetical protein
MAHLSHNIRNIGETAIGLIKQRIFGKVILWLMIQKIPKV